MTQNMIFDDLTENIGQPAESDENKTNDAEGTPTPSEWPKVVDSAPEGALTAGEFAKRIGGLNLIKLLEQGEPPAEAFKQSVVDTARVYQALGHPTNPLPHFLVRTYVTSAEGETSHSDRALIPFDEAAENWFARTAGSGGAGLTEEQKAKRILQAGKHRARAAKIAERLVKVTEDDNKAKALTGRYTNWLADMGATWDDAIKAYDEFVASSPAEAAADIEG